jgi:glycosyltransferase
MNKGVAAATGDVIAFLNSDDFYYHPHVLQQIAIQFATGSIDACYGNLIYVKREDIHTRVRYWRAGEYQPKNLRLGWIPPHPSFFVKKELFTKYGLFRLDFSIAADYELMLRFITKGMKMSYLDEDITCMREGGHSAKSIRQRFKGWKELYRAWKVNGLKPPLLLCVNRPLRKLHQFFLNH